MGRIVGGGASKRCRCRQEGKPAATVGAGGVFSRNQWGLFDQTQTSAHRFPKWRRQVLSSCIFKDAADSGWVEPLSRNVWLAEQRQGAVTGKKAPAGLVTTIQHSRAGSRPALLHRPSLFSGIQFVRKCWKFCFSFRLFCEGGIFRFTQRTRRF